MRRAFPFLMVVLLACEGGDQGTAAGSATASSTAAPLPASATTRPQPPRYDDDELHVPADFEADAEQAITKDNYQDALAAMRKAITGEEADDSGDHDDHDHETEVTLPPNVTPAPTAAPKAPPAPAPKALPAPAPKALPAPSPKAPKTED